MRPLYPSAHHDRFAHSLGVYHLASTAFSHICENTDTTLLPGIKLSDYTRPFEIGALMHDCGHSPFSHLFEVHYNRNGRALAFLNEQVSERFKKDYESRLEATEKRVEPAPHEVFSAAIFLKHYGQKYRDLLPGRDPELIARMITGTTYARPENIGEQCENCLIMLINGGAIDVDKLDYIIRDSWASGVNNISIDTTRLLSAMQIVKYDTSLVPGFKKSALSVIQNVVDARNYLYTWIYSHHTVLYHHDLLKDALVKVSRLISGDENPDAFIDAVFSREPFDRVVDVGTARIFLPCDGDIYYQLKAHSANVPQADEILSRTPCLVPLWKTKAEFELVFALKTPEQRAHIRANLKDFLAPVLNNPELTSKVKFIKARAKVVNIHQSRIHVSIGGGVERYSDLKITPRTVHEPEHELDPTYFLVFIPRESVSLTAACVQALKTASVY